MVGGGVTLKQGPSSVQQGFSHGQAAYGTVREVAVYLGCSKKQVRRLISRGLPVYRFGERGHLRIKYSDIDAWMEENCRVQGNDLDGLVDEIANEFM